MKRLNLLLLGVLLTALVGCNKSQTSGDCMPYRGSESPLSIVPGISLGEDIDAVLNCPLLEDSVQIVTPDPVEVRVNGLFAEDIPVRYTFYADSVRRLRYVRVDPLFNRQDTAEAYRVLQSVLGYNQRVYGSPKRRRASSEDEYSAYGYEWIVCDGIHEVLQCATSHKYQDGFDSVTRWMLITISY